MQAWTDLNHRTDADHLPESQYSKLSLTIKYIYIYIFYFLGGLLLGLCSIAGFSLAEVSGGYSIVAVLRILIAVASLIGSRHVGFRSCSALGSRVQTQ